MNISEKKTRIIWSVNLNSQKTISEGRKISIKKAIPNPTIDEIYEAAKILNLDPKKENEKRYPKSWWEPNGRIIVHNATKKKDILFQITKIIKSKRK